MPALPFRVETVDLTLDDGGRLLLPLFYPEVSAIGRNLERLTDEIHRGVAWIVANDGPVTLYRRRPTEAPQVRQVRIELDSPHTDVCWTQPVELVFHVITWAHGEDAVIAYVPALDIEVVAEDEEQLQKLLPSHIRFALMRQKATASLRPLVWLQRVAEVEVRSTTTSVSVRTPRERAVAQEDDKPSTLRDVTTDLTHMARGPVFEREPLVARLAEALTGRRPRSALLVGASGVGKTALVLELARRRAAFGLANTPLRATSGARLVSGMTGYGMWQERCQKLCREAAKQKALLYLGNLLELMEVGKHEGNQQGVASFLRPHLERGDVLAICECTPEQLTHIERRSPNLLDAFFVIRVEEPTAEQSRSILHQYAAHHTPGPSPLTDDALDAIDRLHRRYATYSANPGRPLRFLHNLLEDRNPQSGPRARRAPHGAPAPLPLDGAAPGGDSNKELARPARQEVDGSPAPPLDAAAVTAAFAVETGLPLDLLDESRRLDLAQARQWFMSRVIGQDEAVDLIVDLLATIKASLTRPHRPIASLLFIGPTGVGKTEMAKTLAEFLYNDARRMTRIDMSEYADPLAADRLIGGTFHEEGFLTARIREQPFGVVLLDEFEKAHPRLFDMLLQVLGEGRLTDAAGRLADFSNAVVIMTSNLGAEDHKRAALGFGDEAQAAEGVREHYLRAVRRFLRPELVNRIDRVVPFNPLGEKLLRRIARRELNLLEQRDGVRYRDLHLDLTDDLAAHLTERGYNPRYGARPLKRAIERELLAPLADALNQFAHDTPLTAEIEMRAQGLRVKTHGRKAEGGESEETAGVNDPRVASVARQCVELRREAFRLQQSHAVLDIENTVFRLEQIERKLLRGKRVPQRDHERLQRLAALRKLHERVSRLSSGAAELEDRILLACYQGQAVDTGGCVQQAELLSKELSSLVFDLYTLNFGESDLVTLVVYGEEPEWLHALALAYYRLAKKRDYQVSLYALRTLTESIYHRLAAGETEPLASSEFFVGLGPGVDRAKLKQSGETVLRAAAVNDPLTFLATEQEGVVGLALRIRGPLAFPLLEPENGLHTFREEDARHACLVHTVGQDFGPRLEYRPPDRIDRRGAIGKQPLRRHMDFDRHEIDDRHLESKIRLGGRNLEEPLVTLTQRRLAAEARKWLGL